MTRRRLSSRGGRSRPVAALLVAAFVAIVACSPARAEAAAEPIERTGEILLTASEAWAEPGFRLQLHVGTESLTPLDEGPAGGGLSLTAEPGVRLSRHWSLAASLHYTISRGEMWGLRWRTTADLGFHPIGGLFVAAGAGYAGVMANTESWSAHRSCTGSGWTVLGRIGYLIPLGQLFATGPVVQTDFQAIRCNPREEMRAIASGPDGESFQPGSQEQRRSWRHRSLHFAWTLAWR